MCVCPRAVCALVCSVCMVALFHKLLNFFVQNTYKNEHFKVLFWVKYIQATKNSIVIKAEK